MASANVVGYETRFGGPQENVLVRPEATAEQDPSARDLPGLMLRTALLMLLLPTRLFIGKSAGTDEDDYANTSNDPTSMASSSGAMASTHCSQQFGGIWKLPK
jgi:hypothetical protein